jgi:hypothetical protein
MDNSDSEENYINVEDLIEKSVENIYQLQINNNILIIKHIGSGSNPPDMIIKENFGIQNKMSLYSCLYGETELTELTESNKENANLYIPIVKLINQLDNEIYSISVNINQFDIGIQQTEDFDINFTYGQIANPHFNFKKLDKNINPSNIVEIVLENIINLGRLILDKPNNSKENEASYDKK